MKRVDVVIGANYGDEGKGQQVHRLVENENSLVVRYSGGAQAAHTVVHGDEMFVFRHLSAGSFLGCPTLLTKEFILNPVHLIDELDRFGRDIRVYVDPYCRITTPADVILNQAKEYARGSNNHGSCGMGIFETTLRHKQIPFHWKDFMVRTKAESLAQYRKILGYAKELLETSDEYYWSESFMESLDREIDNPGVFIEICELMRTKTICVPTSSVLRVTDHVIFEGSQGLMLDEDYGVYPYLTPGSVGLQTPSLYIEKYGQGVESCNVHWVTRPYLTRHGAGPLPDERPMEYLKIYNQRETNVRNQFQGHFRYGIIDCTALVERVWADMDRHMTRLPESTNYQITVTCSGHLVEGVIPIFEYNGVESWVSPRGLADVLGEKFRCGIAEETF